MFCTKSRSGNPHWAATVWRGSDSAVHLSVHVCALQVRSYVFISSIRLQVLFPLHLLMHLFSMNYLLWTAVQTVSAPLTHRLRNTAPCDIFCASSLCWHGRGHESMNKPWPLNCKVFGESCGDIAAGAWARAQGWAINQISWMYLLFWQLEVISITSISPLYNRDTDGGGG